MQNYIDEVQEPDDIRRGMMNRPRSQPDPRSVEGRLEAETEPNPLAINMVESAGEVIVETVIPATDPADIDVLIDGSRLTIAADVLDDYGSEDDLVHLNELIHGRYERSVQIPTEVDVDGVEAEYDNGLLTVRFPKAHPGVFEKIAEGVNKALSGSKSGTRIPVERR
jgi:HSP20 family molecular chaperone IbpA